MHVEPIRYVDIYKIVDWRNRQINILRQNKQITHKEQFEYYCNKIYPSFFEDRPEQVLFSILDNNECIGYGGLVHIEHDTAELSFLLKFSDSHPAFKNTFCNFFTFMRSVAKDLRLSYITSEVYDKKERKMIIKYMELLGFREYKRENNSKFYLYDL